ncbi:MAG: HEAT repeat domain-containing protein [Planctomycetota bacterium]
MRAACLVALLGSLGHAGDAEDVRGLVEHLGAPTYGERQTAYAKLARYGEKIIPLLQKISVEDPEIRRQLRELTRAARKLALILGAPTEPLSIGSPLVLNVRLVNDTDDTYLLPVTRGLQRGHGTLSSFSVTLDAKDTVDLRPDQIEWTTVIGRVPILRPGEFMHATVRLEGERTPLRRPGEIKVAVAFLNHTAQRWRGPQPRDRREADAVLVTLRTPPVVVTAYGRKVHDLERALRDPKRRRSALAELAVREDGAVLPLLRRHAADRELRLAAVRRLGANGADEDFDLVYKATRDRDARVRRAAVLALGSYLRSRARRRLIALAQDHELKAEAVRALRKHKHPVTIDLFVRILRKLYEDREVVKEIQQALYEWTGMVVKHRASEVRAFEEWWARNRRRWTRENLSGR